MRGVVSWVLGLIIDFDVQEQDKMAFVVYPYALVYPYEMKLELYSCKICRGRTL